MREDHIRIERLKGLSDMTSDKINLKNQKFGIELEFTGMTRERAARKIQAVVGGTVHNTGSAHNGWYVLAPDGRKWKIMGDGSIAIARGGRRGQYPGEECEFVTPICTYDDIPTVQECIRALRRAGAKVNGSCGCHIHVDAANHTAQSLKNLVFTMKAKQGLIFKAVGTQASRLSRWCQPIDDALVNGIKGIKKKDMDTKHLRDLWYDTYAPGQSRAAHYNSSRYHALNLHSTWQRGSIEFRIFEASLHAGEIRAWLNLCLAMSAQAINQTRTSPEVLDTAGNDKYAMRCWLLRLGFIGDEWKEVREHLLKNLQGNAAWRNAPETYESYRSRRSA